MKRFVSAFCLIVLFAAISVWAIWDTKPLVELRVRRVLRQPQTIRDPQVLWESRTLTVKGRVKTRQDYARLSRQLALIVGAGHLINETQVESLETLKEPNINKGTITIPVNTNYDDSDESIKEIKAIIQLPQFEWYKASAGQNLSSIILDRYRFSPTDLPKTYAMLQTKIIELNQLTGPDTIKEGELRIPVLPARVQNLPPPNTPTHEGFAHYSLNLHLGEVGVPLTARVAGVPVTSVAPTESVRAVRDPTFILSLPVTAATESSTNSLLAIFPSLVKSKGMHVTLAATPAPGSSIHKTLTPQDTAILSSTLKSAPRRNTTLFILDDAWPDAQTYSRSVGELQTISDSIRNQYGLERVSLNTATFVPATNSHTHASYIRDSLKEFTDLDKSGVVAIVYIPLGKTQNDSPFLEELLRLYFTLKMAQTGTATDIVKQSTDTWVSNVMANIPVQSSDQDIPTDWAIIEAIWSIGDYMAFKSSNRDVFFINESWTVLPDTVSESHAGVSAGLVVAAVGNDLGRVVNSDTGALDFARLCTSTRSVIAAINAMPTQGIVCNSSVVDEQRLKDTFVESFDGEVYSGPNEGACLSGDVANCVCGTSFSAPRIAWLLALSEAMRSKAEDYSTWNVDLQDRLQGLRTGDSTPWVGEYLRLAGLLGTH